MPNHASVVRPELYAVAETDTVLDIGRSKIYELITSRDLPVIHIGRAVRISRRAIQDFISRLEDAQGGAA